MTSPPDPFFHLPEDPEWNACIGRQGAAENYVDGYIEAAIELASAVLDRRLYGQRDTLAMPILYNARHGLELALKLAIGRLHAMGALPQLHAKNHDIQSHWDVLQRANLGDVRLRGLIADLRPFVESLTRIDDDGQELRYAETRTGKRSLEDRALISISVMRDGVVELGRLLEAVKYRVVEYGEERASGTFTPELSRTDLIAVADRLPPFDHWCKPVFDEVRAELMAEFGLSGRTFSAALDVIQSRRETRRRIGLMTDLTHLGDASLLLAIEQWASCHPLPREGERPGPLWTAPRDLAGLEARLATREQAVRALQKALSLDELADLYAVYQIGRHNEFAEHYEGILEVERKRLHLRDEPHTQAIHYLLTKTNLQVGVVRGLVNLGRPDLAAQVEAIPRPGDLA